MKKEDGEVLELNRRALSLVPAKQKKLTIIPRASHLFEESGALEEVTRFAADWFTRHLKNGDE